MINGFWRQTETSTGGWIYMLVNRFIFTNSVVNGKIRIGGELYIQKNPEEKARNN